MYIHDVRFRSICTHGARLRRTIQPLCRELASFYQSVSGDCLIEGCFSRLDILGCCLCAYVMLVVAVFLLDSGHAENGEQCRARRKGQVHASGENSCLLLGLGGRV